MSGAVNNVNARQTESQRTDLGFCEGVLPRGWSTVEHVRLYLKNL